MASTDDTKTTAPSTASSTSSITKNSGNDTEKEIKENGVSEGENMSNVVASLRDQNASLLKEIEQQRKELKQERSLREKGNTEMMKEMEEAERKRDEERKSWEKKSQEQQETIEDLSLQLAKLTSRNSTTSRSKAGAVPSPTATNGSANKKLSAQKSQTIITGNKKVEVAPKDKSKTKPKEKVQFKDVPENDVKKEDEPAPEDEFQIAADLTLYANPLRCLNRKGGPVKQEKTCSEKAKQEGDMIAADLKKYGSPLDK